MRAEVPVTLLPAHRRGIERRQQRGPRLRSLDVASRSSASTKPSPRRGRPSHAAPRRAPRATRGPSSRSTSGCRSRSRARTRPASAAGARRSSRVRIERGYRRRPATLPSAPSGTGRCSSVRGRPRTILPSIASCGRTREPALWVASKRVPAPTRSRFASTGTSATISRVNASPRASTASRRGFRGACEPRPAGSRCRCPAIIRSSRRRSRAAIVRVHAA